MTRPDGQAGRPGRGRAVWLARAALLAAAVAVGLFVGVAGPHGPLLLVAAAIGALAALAGSWWLLTRRGARRWAAAVLATAAPIAVVLGFVHTGLLWLAALCCALAWAASALGRTALRLATGQPNEREAARPSRPVLIMNPRSGGGKAETFDLAGRARALGAEVLVVDADAVTLARDAVTAGVDLLCVAGGDGTLAAVAEVAIAHDVPMLVIPAGTRNHFAMDLGLDRDDPSRALDALTDGVEVRVDLGVAGDRTFLNTASFGAYADVVQDPRYRDAKTATALRIVPDVVGDPPVGLRCGQTTVTGALAILVSNNPYTTSPAAPGRRVGLDGGVLGVLAVQVRPGGHMGRITRIEGDVATVEADADSISAGLDGEAVRLPTPVRCAIRPGVLRVRVPRHRRPPAGPAVNWRRLLALALR